MANERQTLEQFIESEIKALRQFQKQWIEGNEKDPDMFPMTLPPGEWDEQLRAWIN